jgi:predicted acyltransferase
MTQQDSDTIQIKDRLLSLDFFRGLTMFLLIAGITGLSSYMVTPELEGTFIYTIGTQLHHHPWNGLHFWDLIQPFFMFIVGVAIPYSYANRVKRGQSYDQILKHTIKRSFLLLVLGWALVYEGPEGEIFCFQNVLAQLSVTYLLAFLVMRKPAGTQIIISLLLLVVTEAIYRLFPVEGFNHPFVANENFGTWLDLQYGGANLSGHWVSFNAIPSTAHTIWGVLTGQLLMSKKPPVKKLAILVTAGIIGLVAGYALNPVTPIIKRICTSSFILASGGWTILTLAFFYWIIDIMKLKKWTFFFVIVGMNPLFIYLFAHIGGARFLMNVIHPFTITLLGWTGESIAGILTSLIVLFLLWYICYWLYKKKIFIKI